MGTPDERWRLFSPVMDVYQLAFDASPDALLVVDGQGRILRANPQVELLFGWPWAELLGRDVELLVPERFRARHVRHRADYLAEPKTRPMGANLELFGRRLDGSEFPVDIMLSSMTSSGDPTVLCVVRDVTERHKADEMFRALLEGAPDAMVIVDDRGCIVRANSQAERVFGYARVELLGQSVDMLIPERLRGQHPLHRRRYFAQPGFRPMGVGLELYGLRKDGSEFPVEISLSPLETEDGVLVSSAIRDISDRKETKGLVQALREKEVLLKKVHHRVKNNFAVISSMFYLQTTYTDDARTVQILQENQERVRCMALVHERLYRSESLASIDFGDYALRLCKNLLQTYRPNGSDIRLRTELESVHLDLDLAIPCGLILNELLTNALIHGFAGGRSGSVHVALETEAPGRCTLRVVDDGVGFSPHTLEENHSLGLRLIRSLAKQVDGDLEMRALEPGTEARLSFPVGEAS